MLWVDTWWQTASIEQLGQNARHRYGILAWIALQYELRTQGALFTRNHSVRFRAMKHWTVTTCFAHGFGQQQLEQSTFPDASFALSEMPLGHHFHLSNVCNCLSAFILLPPWKWTDSNVLQLKLIRAIVSLRSVLISFQRDARVPTSVAGVDHRLWSCETRLRSGAIVPSFNVWINQSDRFVRWWER
jgi:hypothetical protein